MVKQFICLCTNQILTITKTFCLHVTNLGERIYINVLIIKVAILFDMFEIYTSEVTVHISHELFHKFYLLWLSPIKICLWKLMQKKFFFLLQWNQSTINLSDRISLKHAKNYKNWFGSHITISTVTFKVYHMRIFDKINK